jgi:hypothetical protein
MDQANTHPEAHNDVRAVIGFDLGDAESVLAAVSARSTDSEEPKLIRDGQLTGGNHQAVIKTVVGYSTAGEVMVGFRAAKSRELRHAGLHVGFKLMPTEQDVTYARLVHDFVGTVLDRLGKPSAGGGGAAVIDLPHSRVVIGHPSKWSSQPGGKPIEVLRGILAQTSLRHAAAIELIPESRAAMVEAIKSGDSEKALPRNAQAGWILVVDIGSSTTDFTVIHAHSKSHKPIDLGEELGARLIDRELVRAVITRHGDRPSLEGFFAEHPEELARFELACRDYKEAYFSTGPVLEGYRTTKDGVTHEIAISIDHALMSAVLEAEPVITIQGRPMAWRAGFAAILGEVATKLSAMGIEPVTGIVLVGGGSMMDFVALECARAFPVAADNQAIVRGYEPAVTVANGLARWGRIQINTDRFAQEVAAFCDREIGPRADKMATSLFDAIAQDIAVEVCALIKEKFDDWKASRIATINDMKRDIAPSIEAHMRQVLPRRIEAHSAPLLASMGSELAQDLKALENRYQIQIGTLSGGLSGSIKLSADKSASAVSLGGISWDGGFGGAIGSIVGVISGLVTGVVMLNVVPIVLLVVVKIVAMISLTLGGILFTILTTNPVGWMFLVAILGFSIAMGAEVRSVIESKFQEWNLPGAVRKLVGAENIHREIDKKKDEILKSVSTALQNDAELRQQVVAETSKFFKIRLMANAEDARLLIG